MKLGLVGVGVVGGAFANALEVHTHHTVKRYDPQLGMRDDISDCDVVFVTVYFGVENQEVLSRALEETARKAREDALIVVRSTVLPETCDKFSALVGRPIAYMPEFLREATNVEDALYPDKIVIGAHEPRQFDKVLFALGGLVKPGKVVRMKPVEAELVKLAGNLIRLVKVILADEIAQVCEAYKADYSALLRAFNLDWALNPNHLDPFHGGHRGAGGRCLPKDAAMFIHAARLVGAKIPVAETANAINWNLLNKEGKVPPGLFAPNELMTSDWPIEARP